VGAYRFAATDVIATARGVRGLYTRSLFRYDLDLTGRLGPALELGRSFVRVEYQREYGPLLLLWQGIGRFLVRHPRLRRLIGPVSVSAAYHPATRDVIVNALEHPEVKSPLSPLVAPRRPYRRFALTAAPVALDDLGGLVKDLEGRGIPVLLRQYLKLGARTLAVSVDPAFSNVVDALVVVDLDAVDVKTLSRYMGADGARAFFSAPPAAPINSAA
jgi:putative hemolysin